MLPGGDRFMTGVDLEPLLPDWLPSFLVQQPAVLPEQTDRMALVIALARYNVEQGTGGPFGAAVFERDSGRLVAVGVNRVLASHCSHAHAEMLALAIAQQRLGSHDLGAPGLPAHELVASCEPCAMCLGAIPWSGVRRLVCAASEDDAMAIGFDEGPKPADWRQQLETRGIEVVTDLARAEARAVLERYASQQGAIYNPRRNSS